MKASDVKIGERYRMLDYYSNPEGAAGTIVQILPDQRVGGIVWSGPGFRLIRVVDLDAGTERLRRGEELEEGDLPEWRAVAVALAPIPICARKGCSYPVTRSARYHEAMKFCSPACRKRAWRARHADPSARKRICERCGDRFEGRRGARYCSTRCRVAAHRTRR